MRANLQRARHLGVAALVVVLSACASTQCEPPHERRGGRETGGGMAMAGSGSAGDPRSRMLGEYAAHLADTQKRLTLAPVQQAAWNVYAAKAQALMADQLRAPAGDAQDNALRAIDRRVDVVRNRYAAMEDVADAARALYQSLDAEQQRLADRLLPATVPALYSGLGERAGEREPGQRAETRRPEGRGERGAPR
jgi:hypothetical protein